MPLLPGRNATNNTTQFRVGRVACVLPLLLLSSTASHAQSSQELLFSVDWHGGSVGSQDSAAGIPMTEADILTPYDGFPNFQPSGSAGVVFHGGRLGLPRYGQCVGHSAGTPCGLEVDGISTGLHAPLMNTVGSTASLYFSVDEYAVGRPTQHSPSLFKAAPLGQSSAAIFSHFLTQAGPLQPPSNPSPTANTMAIDGDGYTAGPSSLVGIGLQQPNPPGGSVPPDLGDNLDALDFTPNSAALVRLYFSLDGTILDPDQGVPGSGSAQANGGFSGADILRSNLNGSSPVLFASAAQLGLGPADDVNGFTLSNNGLAGFQPSKSPYDWMPGAENRTDMLLFTVRKGSPIVGTLDSLLGIPIEPGDILTTPPMFPVGAPPGILYPAESLGLSSVRSGGVFDDLDGIVVDPSNYEDCDGDGIPDDTELANGSQEDRNKNGIPDDCEKKYSKFGYCITGLGPCGNDDPNAGCVNSTGQGAFLSGGGTTSFFIDDMELRISQLPPNKPGLVFMGGAEIPAVTLGSGLRVVGAGSVGSLIRFPIRISDAMGKFGYNGVVNVGGLGLTHAGDTRYYQAWYRDPQGPCQPNSNTTNGLKVTYTL